MNFERRVMQGIEYRKSKSGPGTLAGYAVKFGSTAQLRGFSETFPNWIAAFLPSTIPAPLWAALRQAHFG
jgi:hypothetical protein